MDFRFQYDRKKPPPGAEQQEQRKVRDQSKIARGLAYGTSIPLTLLSGPLGGYYLGSWLDAHYHWGFATILLIVLCTAGSFAIMIQMLAQLNKN